MRLALLVSFVACAVSGCVAGSGVAGKARPAPVVDSARIAQVEREARQRGVTVLWINTPMERR